MSRDAEVQESERRFALVRGTREPMVWPFRSEEEAQDWALEHGCIDWRVQELADRPEHMAVCGRCKEPWPCEHEQNDREAKAFAMRLDRLCSHCGEEVLPGSNSSSFGGLRFHMAKRYAGCAKAQRVASAEWTAAGRPGRLRPLPEQA